MYEYKNKNYEPMIHDFGDDYHQPDGEEIYSDNILDKVKNIKRRYQDWFEYTDACKLYDTYIDDLIDKYGGESQFKIALLLKKVTEYIPNYPELRKNKKNRYFVKHRVNRPMVIGEPSYDCDFSPNKIDVKNIKVKVKIGSSKDIIDIFNSSVGNDVNKDIADRIGSDLDILQSFYIENRNKIERMKCKKKRKKRLISTLNRKQIKMNSNYRSLTDMIALHDKAKIDKFMNKETYNNFCTEYKGRFISSFDVENINTLEKLREIGVKFRNLSRSQTKLIRRKKSKKDKKKQDKKNRKLEKAFIDKYTNKEFDDFVQFENEMLTMTGSRRFD